MNKTNIEWVKNPDGSQGYTWNPITGCLNHKNGLCNGGGFPCYAYRLAHGRLKTRYLANQNIAPPIIKTHSEIYGELKFPLPAYAMDCNRALHDPFYPRFWPNHLSWLVPRHAGSRHLHTPRGIFVCDMSDLFGIGVPEEWTTGVLDAIKLWPEHRFYLLTKQPQNLVKFSPFPDNCWIGVTATANAFLTNALIGLSNIEAKVKYISFEPLLGDVGMNDHMRFVDAGVNWVIIGAQTKPYKTPKIEWVQEIIDACDKAGVAVFLKDNLWQMPLMMRQEMPNV